ncbi:MAG: glycosyltransferase family 2 protein [Anaerolineae bacterium]|nr:glycosyltransferase family 2 protein [Anaerolineae bacterium]
MSIHNISNPRVTIVIPNWNTRRWLPGCLDGLRAQTFQDFQILLIDNGSTDDSLDFIRAHYPEVEIISFAQNRGFAVAVNTGIQHTHTDYVALLNTDTVPHPDWLYHLVEALEHHPTDVGCVAPKMLSLTDPTRIDDVGDTFSWYGSARKRGLGELAETYAQPEEIFSANAGAALYRRAFLEDVGYFDESFVNYFEDIDLGLRGRLLGYRYLYIPQAKILHQSHGSGLPRARYVTLVTRNRLAILLKNIPALLLFKHSGTLLYGQFYYLLAYKKPWHSLKGTLMFLIALPHILRQRRTIQRKNKLPNTVLDSLLINELGEIPLKTLLVDKFKKKI